MTLFERRALRIVGLRSGAKRQEAHADAKELRDEYPDNGDGAFVVVVLRKTGYPDLPANLDPAALRQELRARGWDEVAADDGIPDPGDIWFAVSQEGHRLVERVGFVVERPDDMGTFVVASSDTLVTRNLIRKSVHGSGRLARPISGWLIEPETAERPGGRHRRRVERPGKPQEGAAL